MALNSIFFFLRKEILINSLLTLSIFLCRMNEIRTISNPLAVGSSDRRVERLLRTINLQTSFFPAQSTVPSASSFLSKAGEKPIFQDLSIGLNSVQTLLQHFSSFCFLIFFFSGEWSLEAADFIAAAADHRVTSFGLRTHLSWKSSASILQRFSGQHWPGYSKHMPGKRATWCTQPTPVSTL